SPFPTPRHPIELPPDPEGDELCRRGLDKPRHHGVARSFGEIMKEAAAVPVWREPAGPPGEEERVPGRARGARGVVGSEQLRVEAAPDAPAVRELRLVVHRESLGHPAGLVLVRK